MEEPRDIADAATRQVEPKQQDMQRLTQLWSDIHDEVARQVERTPYHR